MAKIMSFTDSCGANHPDSYWSLASGVFIWKMNRRASLVFSAWHTKDDYLAGKAPLQGGAKDYEIKGDAFDSLYAQALAPNAPNIMKIAYDYVATVNEPSTGKPFFDRASDDL